MLRSPQCLAELVLFYFIKGATVLGKWVTSCDCSVLDRHASQMPQTRGRASPCSWTWNSVWWDRTTGGHGSGHLPCLGSPCVYTACSSFLCVFLFHLICDWCLGGFLLTLCLVFLTCYLLKLCSVSHLGFCLHFCSSVMSELVECFSLCSSNRKTYLLGLVNH